MKHIVCYSGGHSSALVAIEVARKFGTEDIVLLNHDINENVEDADIKRFKDEVAAYIGVPITYANHPDFENKDQFDVCVDAKAFKVGRGTALCTHRLKTQPFEKYLKEHHPEKDAVIYYGFDANEKHRIQRRATILSSMGFKTDFPLAYWERTIGNTSEIGIDPPLTYGVWKHANCIGCLKAKRQHWYAVYCTRPDIFEKAKEAEEKIGYTILPDISMEEIEESLFSRMKDIGIEPTEKVSSQRFWADAKRALKNVQDMECQMAMRFDQDTESKPCECVF